MWDHTDLIRHRPEPARLDIGPGLLAQTSAWARLPQHRCKPVRPDIDVGSFDRHRPEPIRTVINPSPFDPTSACARSPQHQPEFVRSETGPIGSTLAWARSTRYRTRKTQLDMGLDQLDSCRLCSTLTRLSSIRVRADLAQYWNRADSTRYGPGPTRVIIGAVDSTPDGYGLTHLNMGPDRLCWTWAQDDLVR